MGHVTPQTLVNAARPKDSPLHRFYDWNDKEAAEKWRIEQAKYHLRCILVIIDVPDSKGRMEKTPIRKFFNVTVHAGTTDEPEERGYVTVEQVRKTPEFLKEIIEDAQQHLIGWQDRYKTYLSLRPFKKRFAAVNGEIERLRIRRPR